MQHTKIILREIKMNHKFTFELRHLASGDYDTLLDKDCIE